MRKSKVNRKGDANEVKPYDCCQTPGYAIDPILPYLRPDWLIWEPAAGKGNIVHKLEMHGFKVVASDILTGQSFFTWQPARFDCILTNPPFSIKYHFLSHCYSLQKPFALLMQVDVIGAATAQKLFDQYGIEIVLMNRRVDFEMPFAGFSGKGAHFSTAWFTYGLSIGATLTYANLMKYPDEQLTLMEVA